MSPSIEDGKFALTASGCFRQVIAFAGRGSIYLTLPRDRSLHQTLGNAFALEPNFDGEDSLCFSSNKNIRRGMLYKMPKI